MARPFFSRDRVTDLERFDKHMQTGIELLKQRLSTGYAINFQVCLHPSLSLTTLLTWYKDLIQRVTMDTASEFLFGKSVNSLDILPQDLPQPFGHPLHEHSLKSFKNYPANTFSQAWHNAQKVAADRDWIGWIWPLAEIFGDKIKNHMKIVDEFILPICKDAINGAAERARLGIKKDGVEEDESFLENLAASTSGTSWIQHSHWIDSL